MLFGVNPFFYGIYIKGWYERWPGAPWHGVCSFIGRGGVCAATLGSARVEKVVRKTARKERLADN